MKRRHIIRLAAGAALAIPLSLAVTARAAAAQKHVPLPAAYAAAEHGEELLSRGDPSGAAAEFLAAIQLDPKYLDVYERYTAARSDAESLRATGKVPNMLEPASYDTAAMRRARAVVLAEFQSWAAAHPREAAYQYALGQFEGENISGMPYYQRAIELEPNMIEAYDWLIVYAKMGGDAAAAVRYGDMRAAINPRDVELAFSAANTTRGDSTEFHRRLADLERRFPGPATRARVLSILVRDTKDPTRKTEYLTELMTFQTPSAADAAVQLFDLYSGTDPAKALAFARAQARTATADTTVKAKGGNWTIQNGQRFRTKRSTITWTRHAIDSANAAIRSTWTRRADNLQHYVDAIAAIDGRAYERAAAQLDSFRVTGYRPAVDVEAKLARLAIFDGLGRTQAAYDSSVTLVAVKPRDEFIAAARRYGTKLQKTSAQVDADVWRARDARATPAFPFTLARYAPPDSASLSDYRGHPVLLTFWFPGCGPCGAEFPYFENIYKKYKDRGLIYLAINIVPEQDNFVVSRVEGDRLSFTPLKGTSEWSVKNYQARAAPTNFLIDQAGRIIFTKFRADDANGGEREVELMVEALLSHTPTATLPQ